MYAHINRTQWNPEHLETGVKLTEEKVIPGYRAHPGFRGYLLLTEPGEGGEAVAITLWDTEENRASSAGIARSVFGELKGVLRGPPKNDDYEVRFYVQE
jgi:hypothetical protein